MPTPEPFRVLGIEAYDEPVPLDGQVMLARLTIRHAAVVLVGARLTRSEATGRYGVWLPKGGRGQRVVIPDQPDRDALLSAAVTAYHAHRGVPAGLPLATAHPSRKATDHDLVARAAGA